MKTEPTDYSAQVGIAGFKGCRRCYRRVDQRAHQRPCAGADVERGFETGGNAGDGRSSVVAGRRNQLRVAECIERSQRPLQLAEHGARADDGWSSFEREAELLK